MQIQIDRPKKENLKAIETLFHFVLIQTFNKNEIPEAYSGEIRDLVAKNMADVEQDFLSSGFQEYFLIAVSKKQIVGIMGFGNPNKEIKNNYKISFENVPEIKHAFILPEFQKNGIGTLLFQKLKERLEEKGVKEIVLDSGFASAQIYWKKKIGNPVVVVKNYWNDGTDYLIWHIKLKDF